MSKPCRKSNYRSLFITYNGLTDPLGQSQVLPYIIGLSKAGYELSILSCEKRERYKAKGQEILEICNRHKIKWKPVFFHTKPPIIAKYYDFFALKRAAKKLYQRERFNIIHCRSFLAARIGAGLKRKFGCKYLFDMRGFWVDERVDGGMWKLSSPFYRYAYKLYKKEEGNLVGFADQIVCLTEAGKREIQKWKSYEQSTPITVIPCSADLELFTVSNEEQKLVARKRLGIPEDIFVLGYLGSLGTWYLLDEMLQLFKEICKKYDSALFLILTPDDPNLVYSKLSEIGLAKEQIVVLFAERKEVPVLMKASDISVSFIKPAYSKIASSPTKLGELLAMGIPVICNDIGDVALVIKQSGGGILIPDFTNESYNSLVKMIPDLMKLNKLKIRNNILEYYSLSNAIQVYDSVYQRLLD